MVVLRSGRCYFDLKGWNIRREQFYNIVVYDYLNVYIWSSEMMCMVTDPHIVEIENLSIKHLKIFICICSFSIPPTSSFNIW